VELLPIKLASKALREAVDLLAADMRLARTEAGEIIERVERGAGLLVTASVILIPALVVLLYAAAAALVEKANLSWPIATLIVGGVLAFICAIVIMLGCARLRASALIPEKTVRQLRRDARLIAEQTNVGGDTEPDRQSRAA
jgi:hypothetical protein